jgi:hypothetical protein
MDRIGVEILFAVLALIVALAATMLWWWRKQERIVETAREWPVTEAIVQSGSLESATEGRVVLPAFAFAYHVGEEYYSGRFSLASYSRDPETIIQQMVGRKLQIHYDPSRPEIWFIADERIEGCKVEQKIGPHVIAHYPRS